MNIPHKNWLEWTVFAVALTLVAGVLGYLVYDAMTLGDAPPAIAIEVGQPERQAEHIIVPITVTNSGDQPAEGLQIEVVRQAGEQQERAQFEIPFLPRGARGEGWASFQASTDAPEQFKARVIGYGKP